MAQLGASECFETPDVDDFGPIVSDRRTLGEEAQENIITEVLDSSASRDAFSSLSPIPDQDFSGSISHLKNNKLSQKDQTNLRAAGFLGSATEYEVLERKDRAFESPLQRYNRLNSEIVAFLQDLRVAEEEGPNKPIDGDLTAAAIAEEVANLQSILAEHVDTISTNAKTKEREAIESEKLLNIVRQAASVSKQPASGDGAAPSDSLSYQLYYNPAAHAHDSIDTKLEDRIAALETMLISADNSQNSSSNLIGKVEQLEQKMALLDESTLAALSTQLEEIAAKTETPAVADKIQELKLNQMAESLERMDKYLPELPHIVERLTTLKEVHEQSANFAVELQRLSQTQEAILTELKESGVQLQTVEQMMAANMKTIEDNVTLLQGRIDALKN